VRMERGIGEFVLHDTTLASLALEALPGTDVAADWQNRPRRIGGLVSLKATGACDLCSVSRHRFRPRGQLKDASLFPVAIPNHSGETAAAVLIGRFPRALVPRKPPVSLSILSCTAPNSRTRLVFSHFIPYFYSSISPREGIWKTPSRKLPFGRFQFL
jgi:hypothetical protein